MSRYIDTEPIIKDLTAMKSVYDAIALDGMIKALREAPTADVVEVVRCPECKHFKQSRQSESEGSQIGLCWELGTTVTKDGFCSYGERKVQE